MKVHKVAEYYARILEEVEKVIVGKRDVIEKLFMTILSNGHVLLEDYPGLAKTLMAKTLATAIGCDFRRIQFTPDLLPADITGTYVYNQKTQEFELRKGPIFTNILLADEVNRAPPKTQSALLEAMQERQVTIEGNTHKLEDPFVVFATQNPIEFEGVYPLPEAQIDRFLIKTSVGYPSKSEEIEILKRRIKRRSDYFEVNTVVTKRDVTEMQKSIEDVHVVDDILDYIVTVVEATRNHPNVEVGSSPRGSLALLKLSRSHAALHGRDYVIPDDVKFIAVEALSHRILLRSEYWVKGIRPEDVIKEIINKVPVPKGP
ncbi:MAG: magnesium chelatase [Thermofilum sp. ex4484_79]|nr:MAG: magnesium chelatase [Thermofilum sp. ex4484_79]